MSNSIKCSREAHMTIGHFSAVQGTLYLVMKASATASAAS